MVVYLFLINTIFFMIKYGVVVFRKDARGTQLPTTLFLLSVYIFMFNKTNLLSFFSYRQASAMWIWSYLLHIYYIPNHIFGTMISELLYIMSSSRGRVKPMTGKWYLLLLGYVHTFKEKEETGVAELWSCVLVTYLPTYSCLNEQAISWRDRLQIVELMMLAVYTKRTWFV
jgi:hypothetical protein